MTKEHQEHMAHMLHTASFNTYEGYALNQLYWKLVARKIELKLDTQQTVLLDGSAGHSARMDGYFPALNIQIEVDEQHHRYQKAKDKKREDSIMAVLGARQLDKPPYVIRIDTTGDIDKQVDDAIELIAKRYHECSCPKWTDIKNADIVKNQKCIKYSDNMVFKLKHELVNALGLKTSTGKEYCKHGTQCIPLVHLNGSADIWFPCISDNAIAGWMNSYDTMTHTFCTQRIGSYARNGAWKESEKKFKAGTYRDRYIIFKVKDSFNNFGYKYYGKYKCIACDAKQQKETWKRISVEDIKIA